MKFKTFLVLLCTAVSGAIVFFTSQENSRDLASVQNKTFPDYFPDSIFFSLKGDAKSLEGPVERQDDEGRYMKRVFGLLLQAADKAAKKDWYFPQDGVFEAYNHFLLTSLIVPFHESRYVHIRERENDQCSVKTNGIVSANSKEEAIKSIQSKVELLDKKISEKQFDLNFINEEYKKKMTREENINNRAQAKLLSNQIKSLQKESKDIKALVKNGVNNVWNSSAKFKQLLGQNDLFPDCDSQSEFKQLLFSYDYNDVGIMMFNMKANPGPFERGSILSTNLIIGEGVNLLYRSFNRNASDYKKNKYLSCFKGKDGLDYMNLVRGTWANYNGGHFDQRACRFIDSMNCLENIYNKYVLAVSNINQNKGSADDQKIYKDYNYSFQKDNKALIKLLTEYETNSLDGKIDLDSFSCRFKENDWHFLNNVVEFFHKEESYMHKYLPQASLERKALDELVSNIKNKTNKREFIERVLATNYKDYIDSEYKEGTPLVIEEAPVIEEQKQEQEQALTILDDEEGSLPQKNESEEVYLIKGRNVNLRYSPEIVSDNKCGHTGELKRAIVQVELVEKNIVNGFYKVRSPLFQELSSADCAKDEVAYVWADFVVKKEILEKEREDENVQYGVITSGVKIRTSYKSGAWTGRVLSKGERVGVIEKIMWGDPWFHIVTEDGFEGWVWQNVELE